MIPFLPGNYTAFGLCVAGLLGSAATALLAPHLWAAWLALALFAGLTATGVHDVRQARHAILRNYPVIGHLR